jgi:hypothetical protein
MSNKYGIISFDEGYDKSAGFFSNYFSILSTFVSCLGEGLHPLVNTANTWFNPTYDFEKGVALDATINPWNWWFEQKSMTDGEFYKVPIQRRHINQHPAHFVKETDFLYFRDLADKYCKIHSHILQEEEELYKWFLKGKTTLGILARGTEMLRHHKEYPKVEPQGWPKYIEFCLEQHPDIDNLFLVSDDMEIVNSIVTAFPQARFLPHYFRSSVQAKDLFQNANKPWWLHSPDDNPNHRKRLGEECLIQAGLLGRCQYFVGAHSGVTSATHFFNKEPFKMSYLV